MTDIDKAKVISALCQKTKFEFQTFLEKNSNFCNQKPSTLKGTTMHSDVDI